MIKRLPSLLACWFLLLPALFLAQPPEGYYSTATGLNGEALKAALHDIVKGHTTITYSMVTDALKELDEDPLNSNNVILIYKQTSLAKTSFGIGNNDWNREHLWPVSHGNFGTDPPAGTDLHHIRPADVSVNNDRGDKDFDNGGTAHPEATLCKWTATTWEPPDAVKGDIARAMFYMVARYEGSNGEVDLELQDNTTTPTSGNGYLGVLSTLMQWHQDDPVDDAERARNNTIYNSYQNNRNPFIDHPEFVNYIWGDGLADEPENHVTGFSANTITLSWSDAAGPVTPDAYLVRMSDTDFGSIADPENGTPVPNNFWNKNVSYGKQTVTFGGLTPGQTYYFNISGYTGSGGSITCKTDGQVQQVSLQAN